MLNYGVDEGGVGGDGGEGGEVGGGMPFLVHLCDQNRTIYHFMIKLLAI